MAGRNVFEEQSNFSTAKAAVGQVIFISHRKVDVKEAREVAETLLEMDFDIYFDEKDKCLAGADEESNPKQVVNCIDTGLARSTHLLGIITEHTCGSWWVPYEIGAFRARRETPCAFLVGEAVKVLPAYMAVARVLKDRIGLKDWLSTLRTQQTSFSSTIPRGMKEAGLFYAGPKFVPLRRDDPPKFQPTSLVPAAPSP